VPASAALRVLRFGPLAQRHLDLLALAVPEHRERHRLPGPALGEQVRREVLRRVHRAVVDGDEDVTADGNPVPIDDGDLGRPLQDAGDRRPLVGAVDVDALGRVQVVRRRELRVMGASETPR